MLKFQLTAFKYISRNVPLPPALQQVLQGNAHALLNKDVQQRVTEAAFARAYNQDDAAAVAAGANAAAQQAAKKAAVAAQQDGIEPPFTDLRSSAPFGVHRVLVPSALPVGLDPVAMAQERERRIRNRIAFRIAELESLPANLPDGSEENAANENAETTMPSDKIKALVELKSLRLLEKQRKMRAEVIAGLKRSSTLATAVSRTDYRRVKKPSVREIRLTEKAERQQRIERERKEKQKQVDYIGGIVQHGRDMLAHRKALAQKQLKLGKYILHWHQNNEREEQKQQERLTKERIRALKEDDEEAYLKLIDKQKDTRLTHLLQQTGQYLDTLASLVMEQQEDIRAREGVPAVVPALPVVENAEDEEDKVDYFRIAHRVQEPVHEQANLLVGGKLKEYQIKGLEWMVSLYNNKLNGIVVLVVRIVVVV
jgi:ATP-dependent helicase STH1/SNF2